MSNHLLRSPRPLLQFLMLLALAAACGCGRKSDTESVTGKVMYRGQPVAPGAIMFFPSIGPPITAPIDDAGQYAADLPPGDYVVIANLSFIRPPDFKEGDPLPKPKFVLPDQYSIRAKSTLKATVAAGQDAPIDFDLK